MVISQIYGGTGGIDSTYAADYIELFNRGPVAVDLSTWSVQFAVATSRNWSKTNLSGSIAPGGYFLVQEAGGAGNFNLPTPDAIGTLVMGTSGKVALVANQISFSSLSPSPNYYAPGVNGVVDFVGYGGPTDDVYGFEGSGPTGQNLSTTVAVFRKDGGCTDTNDNRADFETAFANPRNSASAPNSCTGISVSGACCLGNGTCVYMTSLACAASSGSYRGDYVPCSIGSYGLSSNPGALIDISATGTNITGAGGDSFVTPIAALPFPVNYYGQTCTVYRVDSNGWMTLVAGDGTSSGSNPSSFPGFVAPLAALAPYWDDLTTDSSTTGRIYAQTNGAPPNRQFIVQFDRLPGSFGAGTGNSTSQIIINESSQVIEFRYGTIIRNGDTYPGGTRVASFGAGIKDLSSNNSVTIDDFSPSSPYYRALGTGGPAAARQFTPTGQCPPTGACCRAGACFPATSLTCLVGVGVYSGDGVACTASACLTGACCLQNGTCGLQNPGQCTVISSGIYQGNSSVCGGTACPAVGSCCSGVACASTFGPGNGQCSGGVWTAGGSCSPNVCAGACCNNVTYLCTLATSAAACGAGSTFSPLGTTCNPIPCPLPANDNCTGAIVYPVAALGTTILGGNGSSNSNESPTPPPCIQNNFSRGVWYKFTPTNGHRYEVTTCSALTTYDTTMYLYTGACEGLACIDASVQASNPSCSVRPDAPRIAWCGIPGVTDYILITGIGTGAFGLTINDLGISAICPPESSGVCCRGATCTLAWATATDCAAHVAGSAGAAFTSVSSTCNANSNITPCCYADYNKVGGINVQDIFDFLNDWFGGRTFAVVGGDGESGVLTVQNIFDFLAVWFAGGCT